MRLHRLFLAIATIGVGPAFAAAPDTPSATIAPENAGASCDRLAGHPDDTDLKGPSVYIDGIDVAKAEEACRQAVAENPDERRYLFELGRVLRKKGDFPGSMQLYEQAGAKGSMIALLGIGLFYENGEGVDENYDKAAEYYQKAIDAGSVKAPGYLAALYEYGSIGAAPDPAKAFELYQKGAALGDAASWNNLGDLYDAGRGVARDQAAAEAMYRKAIASTSVDASAEGKNNLAWMWALAGTKLGEAETLVRDAIAGVLPGDTWGKASYVDTLAWVHYRMGRFTDALAEQQEVVNLVSDNAPYFERLGDIQLAAGDKEKAKAAWQKAIELDPPDPIDEPDFSADKIRDKIKAAN